jgi:deoxyadenosine/deoxycytidine kinase
VFGLGEARYIALEGPIAVGKSTVAAALAKEYGARMISEPVEENPFLPKFYEDPERFAFTAQVSFLMERYRQQHELLQIDLFHRATVADYIFAKDRIFAELVLSKDEMQLYERIYGLLDKRVRSRTSSCSWTPGPRFC